MTDYSQLNKNPIFKPVDSIYTDRLRKFNDNDHLGKFRVRHRIDNSKDDGSDGYVELKKYSVPDLQRPSFKEIIPSKLDEFEPCHRNDLFGPGWASFWIQVKIAVPTYWKEHYGNGKKDPIAFHWDSDNEILIYDHEGIPQQSLTGGGHRTEFILPSDWYEDRDEYVFYLEMACNGLFGTTPSFYYTLHTAELIVKNSEADSLYYDFWIMGDAARELPGDSPQKYLALQLCNKIMDTFDVNDEKSLAKCREVAKQYLGPDINGSEVFDDSTTPFPIQVYAMGNCHIDTAWLWPFAETKRKVVRSWTTQIRIMEKYPEYQFVASQGQQFKWLRDLHPEIFTQIKKKLKDNQFFPIGGSWVENDTNMPSGESLIRQFLRGQRLLLNEFGFKSKTFWLPDTFGYSSQIPQICRVVGIENFLTQKLSWNNINKFPQNTFNWVGIDGSQVLTHMPPDNTYTAPAHFGDVNRTITQHKNLYNDQKGLLLYGHGDGGSGATPEMLEKLRRCRGMTNTVGSSLPVTKVGNFTIEEFYDKIRKDSDNAKTLPSWKGELYLEYHRGTYTTQAKVKQYMRTLESLMHDLELIATYVSLNHVSYVYPLKKINRIWEDILLCQFHDVLPGSCIEIVYKEEVLPMLGKRVDDLRELIDEALGKVGVRYCGTNEKPMLLNTFSWPRSTIHDIAGTPVLFNSIEQNLNMCIIKKKVKYPVSVTRDEDDYILDNSKLKVRVNKKGIITSLYDIVNDREVIDISPEGRNTRGANAFVLFDDEPLNFDGWDTELYNVNTFRYVDDVISSELVEEGPLKVSISFKHRISGSSQLKNVISLEGSDDLESVSLVKFETFVDWNKSHKFLKVEFPVDINQEYASYETQFGITRRPTHFNTTWDTAKFEVCSHRFADYSDFNYGVSIINDSKYGFAVHGNLMRLSLLRAPKYPDAHADIGKHYFNYAIYPHKGPLSSQTVKLGLEFNDRLNEQAYTFTGSPIDFTELVKIKGDDNLILSNVKRGEDDDDLENWEPNLPKKHKKSIVIRVYEALGGASKAVIRVGKPIQKVTKITGLEEDLKDVDFDKETNSFKVKSRAFEISSFKIVLK
ncbi:Alpha-mannosidase [Komagataella phaffii CBS 7435]|uniref:Alpha-mannosidase n=2 Tax=Komagataella phaffii TaxID=460519 RepID=C4R8Y4_KOMPG|nr:Vacuolar alpha mannosidase, involved in free oligosaccharide (fOS) degradation [Komagataella phaffii GS115]AOA65028.1 GQ67_05181T0 [Komagataella phaffii]CAH2450532.1 Alpha-mannosidase [Komagataella phaffii CBS 7435]AOA69506.1 GQ68_05163T0 [Komagataella phaffii GS115]CAY72059.1 Vacuolar alpha mannosidase, involved in free oligosaccharide (fOS) degradation [Komagataella phaffii GS115]CCA40336.1 Alpha-mannosidase [Komagataella phaffii CBS 7435]